MEHRDLIFFRKNKLYVANMADWVDENELKWARKPLVLSTTIESDKITSKETKLAIKAKEFIRKAGYPLQGDALKVVRDGNINNMPHEGKDIRNAFVLGEHVSSI